MSLFKFAFLCGACRLRKFFLKYIFIRILTPIFSFKISRKTPTATRISVHYHTTPSSSSSSSYTIIQQSSCYQECRCTDAPSPWWTPTRIGWAPRPRIPHFRYLNCPYTSALGCGILNRPPFGGSGSMEVYPFWRPQSWKFSLTKFNNLKFSLKIFLLFIYNSLKVLDH